MARGTSGNIYDAMDSAAKRRPQEISWGKYTAQSISENKRIFAKLLTTSILKTALGHANVQFAYYFTGREVQGPGMLTPNSASETKQNSSISEKILWYLGVLICLVEKILLLSLALWGGHKLFYGGRPWHSISLMLMLGYFALTPVVFGEPRYFLPGTLVALILGAYSNNQFTKSVK
jgi:hypothetical protein